MPCESVLGSYARAWVNQKPAPRFVCWNRAVHAFNTRSSLRSARFSVPLPTPPRSKLCPYTYNVTDGLGRVKGSAAGAEPLLLTRGHLGNVDNTAVGGLWWLLHVVVITQAVHNVVCRLGTLDVEAGRVNGVPAGQKEEEEEKEEGKRERMEERMKERMEGWKK